MKKKNCWEVMPCGREPGGKNVEELGVCPAAESGEFDGVNDGTCGGRFCWAVAGTLCGDRVQGTYSHKILNCLQCPFFRSVELETEDFILTPQKFLHQQQRKKKPL